MANALSAPYLDRELAVKDFRTELAQRLAHWAAVNGETMHLVVIDEELHYETYTHGELPPELTPSLTAYPNGAVKFHALSDQREDEADAPGEDQE